MGGGSPASGHSASAADSVGIITMGALPVIDKLTPEVIARIGEVTRPRVD